MTTKHIVSSTLLALSFSLSTGASAGTTMPPTLPPAPAPTTTPVTSIPVVDDPTIVDAPTDPSLDVNVVFGNVNAGDGSTAHEETPSVEGHAAE